MNKTAADSDLLIWPAENKTLFCFSH